MTISSAFIIKHRASHIQWQGILVEGGCFIGDDSN